MKQDQVLMLVVAFLLGYFMNNMNNMNVIEGNKITDRLKKRGTAFLRKHDLGGYSECAKDRNRRTPGYECYDRACNWATDDKKCVDCNVANPDNGRCCCPS